MADEQSRANTSKMAIAASGVSRAREDRIAATQAVHAAHVNLRGKVTYGFLFASSDRNLGEIQTAVAETIDAPIIACTTAGELTDLGPHSGSVSVLLVGDQNDATMTFAENISGDARAAVNRLCAGITRSPRKKGISIMLTDGLSGAGEKIVAGVHDQLGGVIAGGAAADNGAFKKTFVAAGARAAKDAVALLHVESAHAWGVGVDHGLHPTTKPMRVTHAVSNIVYQIDGAPAFEVYRRHAAARGLDLRPESASTYMIENELGIHFFDKVVRARAPLSAGSDGSLVCAAEVPRGSMVSILDGDATSMIAAARGAAEEAKAHLEGRSACAVLLFDCICRGMILKDAFSKEVDAVRSVFGDVPMAGFLTYGEIARYTGRLDGWHNATAVVVAIPR